MSRGFVLCLSNELCQQQAGKKKRSIYTSPDLFPASLSTMKPCIIKQKQK